MRNQLNRVRTQVLGLLLLSAALPAVISSICLAGDLAADQALLRLGLCLALTAGLVGLAMVYLTRHLLSPLAQLVQALRCGASGDLSQTVQIHSDNELQQAGLALANLFDNLREMIGRMQTASQQTTLVATELSAAATESATTAREIAATVGEIARGAGEQSVVSEQSLNRMQDVLSQAEAISGQSSTALAATREMAANSQQTRAVLTALIEGIKVLADDNLGFAQSARQLAAQAEAIGGIVSAVKEIAAQTNLLALNAAIEAARAGEHGRGFTVVAEQVRRLSERSAGSATEIATLAGNIRQAVRRLAEQLEESAAGSERDRARADQAQGQLGELISAVGLVVEQNTAITGMARVVADQAMAATDATRLVAAVSQQTAAGAEQTAAASSEQATAVETVSQQAARLQSLAAELHTYLNRYAASLAVSEQLQRQAKLGLSVLERHLANPTLVAFRAEQLTELALRIEREHDLFELVFVINRAGDLLASSREVGMANVAHRPWFREALAGQVHISDPYVSSVSQRTCVTLALPIRDAGGETIGVFGGDVRI